jgi:DNA-binding response OmpR family regulator
VAGTVLLIDKNQETLGRLRRTFLLEGYGLQHAKPGVDAIRRMLVDGPDLVILGLCPEKSDWHFCRRLLTFLDCPLLLLLSTTNTRERVIGLELGADDCMVEPIIPEEVIARVRALLRRGKLQASRMQQSYFVDGGLVVDLTRAEAQLDGQPIQLTPTEFRLLSCLITNVGEVLSHEQLARRVWGFEYDGAHAAIKQYVYQLRQKLEPAPHHPKRIITRRGRGYVLRSVAEA